jgi:hypothetical protein
LLKAAVDHAIARDATLMNQRVRRPSSLID